MLICFVHRRRPAHCTFRGPIVLLGARPASWSIISKLYPRISMDIHEYPRISPNIPENPENIWIFARLAKVLLQSSGTLWSFASPKHHGAHIREPFDLLFLLHAISLVLPNRLGTCAMIGEERVQSLSPFLFFTQFRVLKISLSKYAAFRCAFLSFFFVSLFFFTSLWLCPSK